MGEGVDDWPTKALCNTFWPTPEKGWAPLLYGNGIVYIHQLYTNYTPIISCLSILNLSSPKALFELQTFSQKLQKFKTPKHFWMYKLQFLFCSDTLPYFSSLVCLEKEARVQEQNTKFDLYIKSVLKYLNFGEKMSVVKRGPNK